MHRLLGLLLAPLADLALVGCGGLELPVVEVLLLQPVHPFVLWVVL